MYPQLRCFAACSGFHEIGPAPRNPQLILNLLAFVGAWLRRDAIASYVCHDSFRVTFILILNSDGIPSDTIFAFLMLNTPRSAHNKIFGAKFLSFERAGINGLNTVD